jgi:hypothetical protein
MSVVIGHDAIHLNVSRLPHGQTAGYTTGSSDIKWTSSDWAAHPQGVRICQDSGTDHTADVLDVETGAATNTNATHWHSSAVAAFNAATRPGQRYPAIYTSASNVTPLVNALIAAGIKSGVGLWVANWNLSDAEAVAEVQNAAGPFPIIGVQFQSGQYYDTSVFSSTWLEHVSVKPETWQPYSTDGKTSLAQIASKHSSAPSTILRRTAQEYGAYDPVLSSWLNAVLGGVEPVTTVIPAGAKLMVKQ